MATTAAMTPAIARTDLRDTLCELLDRLDGTESLEDLARIRDELSAASKRFGGRVTRLVRKAAPKKAETSKAAEATPKPTAPAEAPAPQRADVRLPAQPEPQQEQPPEPPPEAPETPPLPPPGPRSWGAWLNSALLALVATVIALIPAGRGICTLVARAARSVARFAARPFRTLWRTVRRSP
jgi:hypothetical protein